MDVPLNPEDASLLDYASMDAKDRFVLMLLDRVQALEGCVATLEQEAYADSLSVTIDVPLDLPSLVDSMFRPQGHNGYGTTFPRGKIKFVNLMRIPT